MKLNIIRVFLIGIILLTGCSRSIYSLGSQAFDKSSTTAISGYDKILDTYETQQIENRARNIDRNKARNSESFSKELEYPTQKDMEFRRLLAEVLQKYSNGLANMANIGSAKQIGGSIGDIGKQLDMAGLPKAKETAGLASKIAGYFLDQKIGRNIRKATRDLDPEIQLLLTLLIDEIDSVTLGMDIAFNDDWNTLKEEFDSNQNITGSYQDIVLIIEMKRQIDTKEKVKELAAKTKAALKEMAELHRGLTKANRRELFQEIDNLAVLASEIKGLVKEL